jgi:hypothetical protein
MIDEVIRPCLINPMDAGDVNTFMQFLFHILCLRLLTVAWSNRDLIMSALHLMFVAMRQDRLIDAVSLSTVCEPDVFDSKDCFELGLQILATLRAASSVGDEMSGSKREKIKRAGSPSIPNLRTSGRTPRCTRIK